MPMRKTFRVSTFERSSSGDCCQMQPGDCVSRVSATGSRSSLGKFQRAARNCAVAMAAVLLSRLTGGVSPSFVVGRPAAHHTATRPLAAGGQAAAPGVADAADAAQVLGGIGEERLRRENEELKAELRKRDGGGASTDGGLLQKIGNGLKSLFGGGPERDGPERQGSRLTASRGGMPGALGLAGGVMGGLVLPMLQAAGGLFKQAQGDVAAVQEEARLAILRSGRLGSRVECGPVLSQSYSSVNINGQQTTQVRLQFQVRGNRSAGMAGCAAAVMPDGSIDIRDLQLDGSSIDARRGPTGGVEVIDV
eukprot:CAMPEP_0179030856 /NCGR_PEP_ID=MMETSP0796-20121207/10776_1 /TAXON_ID=73915 /ORGANISM="Pyrodinium bahamense, Strain pbaha01" /LENGTH=306 /DNA_ID=CAMNT_0020727041 /DNA_START=65 /DNA_END=986 /DNA_ORIENTATION=-